MTAGFPQTVAFYLPQFHEIPENDEWWGKGFTEWSNVRRAKPLYAQHDQPRKPTGPFGEYLLDAPGPAAWQVGLAQDAHVDAFCYYHYWFDGKRLLEAPLDAYLASRLALPFCICWANENWTRRWDGKDREVLATQRYGPDIADAVFDSFLPYLADERYLRVSGEAVLLVHRIDRIPAAQQLAARWRERALGDGVGPLHLVASETRMGIDPRAYGFDAVAEFPPVGDNGLRSALLEPPAGLARTFRGRLMSYERLQDHYMARRRPPFVRHHGVIPQWDNTPRRLSKATIYVGSTPDRYARWLRHARSQEWDWYGDSSIVFINAWNEWAEGAYLEPDESNGNAYLKATRRDYTAAAAEQAETRPGRPSLGWLNSLALAAASSGYVLAQRRTWHRP